MNQQLQQLVQQAMQHFQNGNLHDAKSGLIKILKIRPHDPDFLHLIGFISGVQGDHAEAVRYLREAAHLSPGNAEIRLNLGKALDETGNHQEALPHFEKATGLLPGNPAAWLGRAKCSHELRRYAEALVQYAQALQLTPDFPEAWSNRGNTLSALSRFGEALAHYDQAIRLRPGYAEAWYNKAITLEGLGRLEEAIASYEQAIRFKPDLDFLYGDLVAARMRVCDWRDFDSQSRTLLDRISRGERAIQPFSYLALSDSEEANQKAARIWVKSKCASVECLQPAAGSSSHEKIRVGYYSAHFHNHATAYLMAELFELHDRERFELFAFSFGPDASDEMRARLLPCFARFIDVENQSDREVAELSTSLGIDIAVDLMGFIKDSRPGIFAHRAAPVQVSYLGYPATMGAGFVDYIVADKTLVPDSNRRFFTEKIVCLPNSYQVNDRRRKIADVMPARRDYALPDTGFVFCCFNNNFKISPSSFHSWMRILREVEGSVLWLFEENPAVSRNLEKEATARGVSSNRLVFAKRMALPEHLARQKLADLFLDTLPYNAHTTASDALWSGLPVLTLLGNTFAGRVAASLLNAVGLPELVTHTREEYEALAIKLASDKARLQEIRQRLLVGRDTAPLFDTPLFARHLESAYREMHERSRAGLPPDHLWIKP